LRDYAITDEAGRRILDAAWEAWDVWHAAQAVVDRDGLTVPGGRGGLKAHPLLTVIRDSRAAFLAGLKALNLDIEPLRDRPGRPPGR
jgi:hypothetical protein